MTKTSLGCLAALLSVAAGAAPSLPPPGEYRVDSASSVHSGSGPASSERSVRVDGATGGHTVTTRSGPAGNPSGTQTHAGSGPVTVCVSARSMPPAGLPVNCDTRWQPRSGGAALQASCPAGRLDEHWQQIDARTWERRMSFKAPGGAAGNDPSAAIAMAQRGMSPAQQAQLQAQLASLPKAQATADAMAPVYAQLEQTLRTGTPTQAAEARQQLAALKAAQGGGAAAATTQLTERWTRVADHCKAGS
ncbi:MAG: hypothetical protein QM788_04095 [Roseateles sp.]|uniref:hypothetical protein n=1 Tax=Roseateles sp. TaxID=1971397 RepID=UPI0039E7A368